MKERQRKVQSTHDQCRKRTTDISVAGSEAPVGDVVMKADLRTSGPQDLGACFMLCLSLP